MKKSFFTLVALFQVSFLFAQFSGGDGSITTPYLISNTTNVSDLRTFVVASSGNSSGKYFQLTQDIDMTGVAGFTGIGGTYPFQGKIDGQGFKIKNLNIGTSSSRTALGNAGFFGVTGTGAEIKNIVFENVSIYNTGTNCGAVVANASATVISNCHVTGTIDISSAGSVGGIVGTFTASTMVNCSANVNITDASTASNLYTGGIVGSITITTSQFGYIYNSFSAGSVSSSTSGTNSYSGGIAGQTPNGTTAQYNVIDNCSSTMTINNTAGTNAYSGGIIGGLGQYNQVKNSIALNNNITSIAGTKTQSDRIAGFIGTNTTFSANYAKESMSLNIGTDGKTAFTTTASATGKGGADLSTNIPSTLLSTYATGKTSPVNWAGWSQVNASAGANGTISGNTGTFVNGTPVNLTATPASGYHFVNWTESGNQVSISNPYTFTVSGAKTLVANFEPNTFAVNSGTTNASSITCTTCDVTVASGAELTVGSDKTLKSVTVSAGGKLTISSGILTATNGITLQSDASGTATMVDNYSTPTVSATVQQYVEAGRNWYISSPVSGAPYTVLDKGNSVVEFNELTKAWDPVSSGTLVAGKGYIEVASAVQGTTGTVVFSNKLTNSGNVTVTLSRNGTTQAGFNLVGNPYPSYLRWTKVATANTNVLPTAWFRTKKTALAGGGYTFATVNVADTLNPVIVDNSANTTITKFIPPMQAYWVRLIESPSTTNYTVTNGMRNHADNTGNKFKAPVQKTSEQQLLRLQVSDGTNSDETVVYFNANASNTFDVFDSPKMSNNSALIPEIYTQINSEQMVINGMNTIPYDTEIPLGFTTGQTNSFTIKASLISNFDAGTQIILKDYLDINNPVITDLSDGSIYSFISDVTANNESRFTLLFKAPSVATGINQNTTDNVWISTNSNGQIVVNGVNGETTVAVYNSVGQKLLTKTLKSTSSVLFNPLTTGVYMVTVSNAGKTVTKKVIID